MRTTLDKWKQITIKGLVAQRDRLSSEVEVMLKQRDEIKGIIQALGGDLPKEPKRKVAKAQVHWSKKPGVDPKRVEAWKSKMSKVQKARNGA